MLKPRIYATWYSGSNRYYYRVQKMPKHYTELTTQERILWVLGVNHDLQNDQRKRKHRISIGRQG